MPPVCDGCLKVIKLSVVRLLLAESSDCSKDRVDIYEGWTVGGGKHLARLCGSEAPSEPFLTTSNMAVVAFSSSHDSTAEAGAGFRIEYKSQDSKTDASDSSTDHTQSKFWPLRLDFAKWHQLIPVITMPSSGSTRK